MYNIIYEINRQSKKKKELGGGGGWEISHVLLLMKPTVWYLIRNITIFSIYEWDSHDGSVTDRNERNRIRQAQNVPPSLLFKQ